MPPIAPYVRLWITVARAVALHFSWIELVRFDESDHRLMEWSAPFELRELNLVFKRDAGADVPQDIAECSFHFLRLVDGEPSDNWAADPGPYDDVEGLASSFWATIKPHFANTVTLYEYRWRKDGPAFLPFGDDHRPTVRVVSGGPTPGTSSAEMLPGQVAATVTERTRSTYYTVAREGRPSQLRHRWGRFYLPSPALSAMDADSRAGYFDTGFCEDLANATESFYQGARDADIFPVMYSPTLGSAFSVDSLQVDDVPDVIRSRRFKPASYRAEQTLS